MATSLARSESQTQLPLKKAKKEPDFYVFRLIYEHPKYYEGSSTFPPKYVIPNKDTILFEGAPRQIRYIDGHKSIFVDEQEFNNQPLPDNVVNRVGNEIVFEYGFLRVPAYNKALVQYLKLNNQCEQQENKFKQVNNVYRLLDFGNTDEKNVQLGKKKDEAYDHARSVSVEDMIPHAKFLGIPFIHPTTLEERDMDAIREDYKQKALENPTEFLKYSSNPKIKIRYNIEKGLDQGIITTGIVKNQLHWGTSRVYITDLPTDKNPVDAIVDFTFKQSGDVFYKTLIAQL
jgi:hypothetical protein